MVHRCAATSKGASVGGLLVGILMAASCTAPPASPARQVLKVMVYEDATDHVVDALGEMFRAALPTVDVEMRRGGSGSSLEAVNAVQRADVDFAIAGAIWVYRGAVGDLDDVRLDRLRGVAVLHPRVMHFLVNKDAGIKRIQDLRGRTVGVNSSVSGTAELVLGILSVFGLRNSDVEIVALSVEESMAQLTSGRLDAAFVYGPHPLDAVKTALHRSARLLELSGSAIDRLRQDIPFLRPFEIPEGTYQSEAVATIGLNLVLFCRSDLDERVVYAFTRALFDAMPALSALDESFGHIDLERAPATPIALHAGAARFYREQQLAR